MTVAKGETGPAAGTPATTPPAAKALGGQALVYAAGQILSRALGFLLLPLYTRKLTPADYGIVQLTMLVFEVVSLVAGARIASGIFRLYFRCDNERDRQRLLATAFLLVNISYMLSGLVIVVAATPLSIMVLDGEANSTTLRIAGLSFMVQGLIIIPHANFKLQQQPWRIVTTSVGLQVMQAGLNVLFLVGLGLGVRGVFLSGFIAFALVGGALGATLLRQTRLAFDRASARDLVEFGLPLVGTSAAVLLMTTGGRFALKQSSSLTEVGLYALAVTFGTVLVSLGNAPFMQVWEAERFRVAELPDRDAHYARAFVYLSLSLFIVGTAIAVLVPDYLAIAATPAYAGVRRLVPITLTAYLLQSWAMILDTGSMLANRTGTIARANWWAAFVAVIGYVTLVPQWHAMGAAATLLLAFLVRCALVYVFAQRLTPIAYDWRPIVQQGSLTVATVASAAMIQPSSRVWSLFWHTTILLIYGVIVFRTAAITPADRARIHASARSIFGFWSRKMVSHP